LESLHELPGSFVSSRRFGFASRMNFFHNSSTPLPILYSNLLFVVVTFLCILA